MRCQHDTQHPSQQFEKCGQAGRYHPERVAHQICVTRGLNQGPLTHRTRAAAHILLTTPATSGSVQGTPPIAVQHMLMPALKLSTPSAGVFHVSSGPLRQQGTTQPGFFSLLPLAAKESTADCHDTRTSHNYVGASSSHFSHHQGHIQAQPRETMTSTARYLLSFRKHSSRN